MRARGVACAVLLALGACAPDPVADQREAAEGPEIAGIPEGPLHRAGERCLACHRAAGSGPAFSIAGTIYEREALALPAAGVDVVITDLRGETRVLTTNGAGNFWITESAWTPVFPIRSELHVDGAVVAMRTEIGREGSCGACHESPGDATRMPGVYVQGGAAP